jgi:hypothetical protein
MDQHDAERVENLLRLKTGIGPEQAHRIAFEAHLASNGGEWGTLAWRRDGTDEITAAMPRHQDEPGVWRFTTKAGWELFVPLTDVAEFHREEAS